MIIYNSTTKADHAIAADWLAWLRAEHIPAMTATGCFTHAVILYLPEAEDEEGVTYAIQYHADKQEQYDRYIATFAPALQQKVKDKWGDRVIAFDTIMQVVN